MAEGSKYQRQNSNLFHYNLLFLRFGVGVRVPRTKGMIKKEPWSDLILHSAFFLTNQHHKLTFLSEFCFFFCFFHRLFKKKRLENYYFPVFAHVPCTFRMVVLLRLVARVLLQLDLVQHLLWETFPAGFLSVDWHRQVCTRQ